MVYREKPVAICTYHPRAWKWASKNCRYDLHILPGALWEGRFQVSTIEKGQVTVGMAGILQAKKYRYALDM
jgi:hypothetical protein